MTDIVERLMNRHCCQDNLDQEAAQEIERLREALNEIRFRIDNTPQDMSLLPNSAIFDLIRYLTNMALGEKE